MANINPNKVLALSVKRLPFGGMKENYSPQIECKTEDLEKARRTLISDWIAKSCRFDKDAAGCDDIQEDRYSLRDEGRNPDGSGESYAERNA